MTNLAAMKYLSVDLMILIRTCTPFLVAFLDYLLLGRSLPSLRSWFSLITLAFVTAVVFVREPLADLTGLMWGTMYYICISGSMVYTKKFISDVKLTVHDRVMWSNALCIPPGIILALITEDFTSLMQPSLKSYPLLSVVVSCILGIGMAYTGWALRARVSSLTFTLVGVLCKIGSIAINAFFLQHLAPRSMILIATGILASMFYEEPKLRLGHVDINSKDKPLDLEKGNPQIPEIEKRYNIDLLIMGLLTIAILLTVFWDSIIQMD